MRARPASRHCERVKVGCRVAADVIFVTPDIVGPVKNGGIGTACYHYARSLAKSGISTDILFTGDLAADEAARWRSWYDDLSIGFLCLNDVPAQVKHAYGMFWYSERANRVMRYLKDRGYKYIIFQDWHANGFWTARSKELRHAFSDARLGVICHSPQQWQREGMEYYGEKPFEDADQEWMERECISAVDVLISPTQHMIDWLTSKDYALPQEVVRCPITFEDQVRPSGAATLDREHLIFFGRLETRKGLHVFGAALRRLKADGRKLPRKVSFLGKAATVEGQPSSDYLGKLTEDLPQVELFVESGWDYATATDYIRRENGLVVIPSLLDNFPLTVVESIVNGFCFVAASVGGIPEMIDPAVAFKPTPAELADLLSRRAMLDFGGLRHPYSPDRARDIWTTHVRGEIARAKPPLAAPALAGAARPPISVCVPFYKHDRYLRRMVTAFLRHRDHPLQFVVVNDGTPIEERPEFERMSELLSPMGHIFVSQANAGPGAARNYAVSLAAHDHLLFFDSDNVPFPSMVGRLWDAMAASGADSVSAPFAAVPPMERAPALSDVWFHYHPAGGSLIRSLIDNTLGDLACLVKREAVEAVGGFTEQRRSWEDQDFFMRIMLGGYKHRVYPEPLLFYTYDEGGVNNMAHAYHNRTSLLAGLRNAPSAELAEMVSVFVRDHLARGDRL